MCRRTVFTKNPTKWTHWFETTRLSWGTRQDLFTENVSCFFPQRRKRISCFVFPSLPLHSGFPEVTISLAWKFYTKLPTTRSTEQILRSLCKKMSNREILVISWFSLSAYQPAELFWRVTLIESIQNTICQRLQGQVETSVDLTDSC